MTIKRCEFLIPFSLQKKIHVKISGRSGMQSLLLITILLFFSIRSTAQDMTYTHSIINTLTSKEFAGRGYVNDGCAKAAEFIRQQFDSLKLQSFSKDYFQPFKFPVNTFPGDMEIIIDGKKLVAGDDYIVHAHSSAASGKYRLDIITPEFSIYILTFVIP